MPSYTAKPDFDHAAAPAIGVLITNLGTPDAPTPQALRRYLRQFLSDPRVVEAPRWLWWLILNGIILRVRPARSAKAYLSVWSNDGSPLLVHTRHQARGLAERLRARLSAPVVVSLGMRYGNPSIATGLQELRDAGATRILVLPLYPHYSAATTGSTFDAVADSLTGWRWVPELHFVNHYHDFEPYIDACAAQIRRHWASSGKPQRLLFSYHGIPKRYFSSGDPYHCHCHKTSRLIAERLGLAEDEWLTTFQSRFGREEWLKPYTDETIKSLPAAGVKSLAVFCPGFAADCLETLEEIGVENRGYFMDAGGEEFRYIPALNAETEHLDALTELTLRHLTAWVDEQPVDEQLQRSRERALALGAER